MLALAPVLDVRLEGRLRPALHRHAPSFKRSGPSQTAAWLFAVVSAVFLAGCSPAPPDDEQHILSEIASFREMKDKGFAGPDSPVPPERREALLPLSYFPVSLDYRVPAELLATQRELEAPHAHHLRSCPVDVGISIV